MVYALPAFTLLVWATRVRNVVEQDDWSAAELVVPVGLTLLGVAALVRRDLLVWLAGATVAVWAVRVPLVLARDHGVGFKAVHLVLAIVSVLLAWLAVSSRRRPTSIRAQG